MTALCLAVCCGASHVLAQSGQDPSDPPALGAQLARIWSVRVTYATRDDIKRIAQIAEHFRVDEPNKTLIMEVGTSGVEALRAMGFKVEVDAVESERIQTFRQQRQQQLHQQQFKQKQDAEPLKEGRSLFDGNAACYRTVENTNADLDALAKQYPHLVRVVTIGPTWVQQQTLSFRNLLIKYLPQGVLQLIDFELLPDSQGNPLRAVVIGNRKALDGKAVPRMVTTSSIHAREYTPAEISARFAEWLVKHYGSDPTATWLLDKNEFHFIVHANPDGRKLAEQTVPQNMGAGWRKNVNFADALCTERNLATNPVAGPGQIVVHPTDPVDSGVDLNRNFPFGWNSTNGEGSSGNPCSAVYRGKQAMSEPETAAIVKYIAGTRQADGQFTGGVLPDRRQAAPDDFAKGAPQDYAGLYFDIHSFSKLVLWPWGIKRDALGDTSRTANDFGMSALAQRLAWYNGYRATQMINYDTDGTTDDTFYGELGAPSFVIELGSSFYEPCDQFEKDTLPKNMAALRYSARTLKAPYRLGLGPDAADIRVSTPQVQRGTPVAVTATIDDDRYLYDAGFEGNAPVTKHEPQAIRAAYAYIDTLPWEPGAKAIPLSVSTGGAFGSGPTIRVSGRIETAGLAPGKHLVYIQGVNRSGHAGPPDAVFLEVLDQKALAQQGDDQQGGAGAVPWWETLALLGLGLLSWWGYRSVGRQTG